MKKGADDLLLAETTATGKGKWIDAAKVAVRRLAHQALDGIDRLGVRRLPERRDQGFGFAQELNVVLATAFAYHDLVRGNCLPYCP